MQSGVSFLLLIVTKTDKKKLTLTLIQLSNCSDSGAVNQNRGCCRGRRSDVCGKVVVAVLDMLSCATCDVSTWNCPGRVWSVKRERVKNRNPPNRVGRGRDSKEIWVEEIRALEELIESRGEKSIKREAIVKQGLEDLNFKEGVVGNRSSKIWW